MTMRVIHIASGKAAIAERVPRGLCLVQFNDVNHPHGHRWHLYPRHHFRRRKDKPFINRYKRMK